MIVSPFILLAVLSADPTKPSLVALDFKDRPIPEVVAAIAARSGNPVALQYWNEGDTNPRKITLQSAEPVPFWDALDRFCLETKIQRSMNDGGAFGVKPPSVALYGAGSEIGPAQYSGPFRLGKFALHAYFRKQFAPSSRSGIEPEEGHYAEFEVLPEPRVLAIRTGPIANLEAIDEAGRSLLDPKIADAQKVSGPFNGHALGGPGSLVRVKLARPPLESKLLKSLKGAMPVEVAILPKAPTFVINLSESVGKTFKTGDLSITIEEFGAKANGPTLLKVVARIEGARGPSGTSSKALVWERSGMIARSFEVVDAEGRPVPGSTPQNSANEELRRTYQFAPASPGRPAAKPKTLRIYAPDWVTWEIPFEFKDVPLP